MAPRRIGLTRQLWVFLHRWAGLTLALFLTVASLTGMALAWEGTLEEWTAPQLLLAPPPTPGAAMRDPVAMRAAALARHPGMVADFLPLTVKPGHALRLRVSWRMPARQTAPDWDELFIDPYTGRELGHRRWGDLSEGMSNLLPFIYRLHYSLLLGPAGELVMGLAALVWMLDCFVGFYLTWPVRRHTAAQLTLPASGWWQRWLPSWRVRWGASRHKLTFDLHRAGGLWVWPILLVFAWSSVSFNLPQVYAPVMGLLGARDQRVALVTMALPHPRDTPRLDFGTARRQGEALARAQTAGADQTLGSQGVRWLWYLPSAGVYIYGFTTSADVADDGGVSQIVFDSDSGALRQANLSGAMPAANRVTNWLQALHMARVLGWPWRIVVTLLGAAIAMLGVTGILVRMKKRHARLTRTRNLTRARV